MEGAQKLYKLRSLSSTPPENLSSAPLGCFSVKNIQILVKIRLSIKPFDRKRFRGNICSSMLGLKLERGNIHREMSDMLQLNHSCHENVPLWLTCPQSELTLNARSQCRERLAPPRRSLRPARSPSWDTRLARFDPLKSFNSKALFLDPYNNRQRIQFTSASMFL